MAETVMLVFIIVSGIIALAAHIGFGTLLLIWIAAYVFLYLEWTWYV